MPAQYALRGWRFIQYDGMNSTDILDLFNNDEMNRDYTATLVSETGGVLTVHIELLAGGIPEIDDDFPISEDEWVSASNGVVIVSDVEFNEKWIIAS
jgi:hypothetical protein